MTASTLDRRLFPLLALAVVLIQSACSGGGGSSPTDPEPPASGTGSALVTGKVLSVTGTAGAGAPVGGITVRVHGTALSTVTAADGRFDLSAVPDGNRQLVFESASSSAALTLERIVPGEQIQLQVAIQGSQVTVASMSRGAGAGTGGALSLTLQMQPDTWNTNWVRSSGTVSALIRGTGFERVDRGSITLVGTDLSAAPLPATRVDLAGNHVRAFFRQADALRTLEDPQPGQTHTVTVSLTADGKTVTLEARVRIVGPGGSGDDDDDDDDEPVRLTVDVQPDSWNTNWAHSSGTVSARIRGEGFERVDLGSIRLIGTAPTASPLVPTRAQREGNHVRAFFSQSQAIGVLDTPVRGETHVVTIRLTVDGQPLDLTAVVRVVGPAR